MNDFSMEIVSNFPIADQIWKMVLKAPNEFFKNNKAGQFIHMEVPNASLTLRRPISIHSYDPYFNQISIIYAIKGRGTAALSNAAKGSKLNAIGPLGNGFEFPDRMRHIALLGGGLGIAPLNTILEKHPNCSYSAFLGWRSKHQVYGLDNFANKCTFQAFTDDGSFGQKGFAVDGLIDSIKRNRPDAVMACGPLPMLKSLKEKLPPTLPCYVSLEQRMGCGVGACLVCACKVRVNGSDEYKRVCADGPIFKLDEVIFDD